MPGEFDFAVVGAGPAGAAVALCLARQGRRVALCAANVPDDIRPGETLPPEIDPVLRELGIRQPFLATDPLEAPGIVSRWGEETPAETDFVGNPNGCGWHVDRRLFDRMLCSEAASAGAAIVRSARVFPERRADGWLVGEVTARFLVDASGSNGLRLDESPDRETDDELLAIVLHVAWSGDRPADLRTCIETTPAGWWYTCPLPPGDAVAMFFTSPAIYLEDGILIEEQLADALLTRERLAGSRLVSSKVVRAGSSLRRNLSGEGWLAVGDSASAYDPLSGRGIFKALRHAQKAALALDGRMGGDGASLSQYTAAVRAEFAEYRRQRRMYYGLERRWPESRFWRARRYSA